MQENLKEIRSLDAEVIAVSRGDRSNVKKTQKALGLEFILIPGPDDDIWKKYEIFDSIQNKSIPATFIIDKNGFICSKYVSRTESDRPDPSQIILELRNLPLSR